MKTKEEATREKERQACGSEGLLQGESWLMERQKERRQIYAGEQAKFKLFYHGVDRK